jgi:hypothetical protein
VTASADIPQIRPQHWVGVRVGYDRSQLAIWTDEGFGWVLRGTKTESRPLATSPEQSLTVGGFTGLLDDFRFAGVHSTEPLRMPAGVVIEGAKPYTIRFLGGRLDPAAHLSTQVIRLRAGDRVTRLNVATNGMLNVDYADVASAPKEEPDKGAPGKAPEKE